MNVSSVKNSQETVFQNCKRKENAMQKTPAGRDFFVRPGKRRKRQVWSGRVYGASGVRRGGPQALDLAVLAEILDGGHGADVIAVVDGVVIGLGVADDEGIGDLELLKEEAVAEEHVDALRGRRRGAGAARRPWGSSPRRWRWRRSICSGPRNPG